MKSHYSRRVFLKTMGLGSVVLTLPHVVLASEKTLERILDRTPDKPNILYIMSDDHAANAISCYGGRLSQIAKTPHIDRLAQEGIRLNNVFCTNSICVPSRATILTGQYSHVNGVYTLRDELDPQQQNVAKLLRQAGYQTAIIGKWHLKTQPSGFDYWNILPGQGRYHNPILIEKEKGEKTYNGYSTDVITDLSLNWLKNRDTKKPFFLMSHFKASHGLWEYAERYADRYKDVRIPEPPSLWEDKSHRSPGSKGYGSTISSDNGRKNLASRMEQKNWPTGQIDTSGMNERQKRRVAYQKYLKDYLRCVAAIDENVGKLLDYLDRTDLVENTIVIYTSDQGMFLGEHNYYDKRWIFDESLRMPFLVRYLKEIKAGTINDDIIINADFAPTFLDYAGLSTPSDMQGCSFRNNLAGKTPKNWQKSMYYRYWMHQAGVPAHYGIRTKDYKLIFFYGLPLDANGAKQNSTPVGWELYDLQKDPYEMDNVYNDPACSEVVKELKAGLLHLKKELGDMDEKYPEMMKLREKYW